MRTTFEHAGHVVTVTKDPRRWHVQVDSELASSRFLDEALETALPELTERQRLGLQLTLLQWVCENGEPTSAPAPQEAAGEWPMPSLVSGWPMPSALSVWPMPNPA
jgi:hypothetical protein